MTIIKKFTKQPGDTLDYDFDFADWFTGRTSTIASVSVPVVDAGINLVTYGRIGTTVAVKTILSGGTTGQSYKMTFRITTTDPTPLVKEVECLIKVKEI